MEEVAPGGPLSASKGSGCGQAGLSGEESQSACYILETRWGLGSTSMGAEPVGRQGPRWGQSSCLAWPQGTALPVAPVPGASLFHRCLLPLGVLGVLESGGF